MAIIEREGSDGLKQYDRRLPLLSEAPELLQPQIVNVDPDLVSIQDLLGGLRWRIYRLCRRWPVTVNPKSIQLSILESAATKAGVPSQVLDLPDRNWISQLVDEFPSLLLPPIMETLHREYVRHGLEWMKQNSDSLKKQFLLMKQLYGPTWILA